MSPRTHLSIAAALGALVVLAGCTSEGATAAPSSAPTRTITGTATGKWSGTPDTLTVRLGVDSRGSSAQAALAENATRATAVIAALKAAGVAPKDLQTSELSLFPTFDQRGRITGYSVSNVVTAKVHDVPNAGKVVDAAAAQAGDDIRVQGVTLSIDDPVMFMAAARMDAVKRARAQASQLAHAAGVKLGEVRKITEARAAVPFSQFNNNQVFLAKSSAATPTPFEPGSQELTVDVTVVFAIK